MGYFERHCTTNITETATGPVALQVLLKSVDTFILMVRICFQDKGSREMTRTGKKT